MSAFLEKARSFAVETGIAELDVERYPYWVLKQEFEPRLPGFSSLVDGVLLIADSTPEPYREHVMWHEAMCVGKNKRVGCVRTIVLELDRVPQELLPEYVKYRLENFEALAHFYEESKPDFYTEILASRDYLRALCAGG
jgi:hypothetical protein